MIQRNCVLVLCFAIFSFSSSLFANVDAPSQASTAREVVEDYFKVEQFLKTYPRDPNCRPNNDCVKVACANVGRFECDETDELAQIAKACRGNWGGECVLTAKKYLGRFEVDRLEDMVTLLESCKGVYNFECVDYTCQRVGRFGCDNLEEIAKINQMCAGR